MDARNSPLETMGVFYGLNTERDSVVVTWRDVDFWFRNGDPPVTFQLDMIDTAGGTAEIVYRYSANQAYVPVRFGLVAPDYGEVGYQASVEDVTPGDAADLIGNTGIAGVWQFLVEDGSVVATEPQQGTDGPDLPRGNLMSDTIEAGAGDDTITGVIGDNPLHEEDGNTWIFGGDGYHRHDTIDGGDGNDLIGG
ncbi:hypothetical protein ACFORG_04975 [Lutimaribacter marinistellae]|uniref:Hemolysin-type calcium-binding repeat-containing protein n=1 Tax=Lutimaribacter marinistellae TaxID=1820329 RepID=A0ABV7TDR4_9RHOB